MSDIKIRKNKDTACLSFIGDLTIKDVNDLKKIMFKTLQKTNAIEINLEAVTMLDLAGLQLLCAASLWLKNQNKEIHMVGEIPESVKTFIHTAGYMRDADCVMRVDGECLWVSGGKS